MNLLIKYKHFECIYHIIVCCDCVDVMFFDVLCCIVVYFNVLCIFLYVAMLYIVML